MRKLQIEGKEYESVSFELLPSGCGWLTFYGLPNSLGASFSTYLNEQEVAWLIKVFESPALLQHEAVGR